jgi:hypothetical protein
VSKGATKGSVKDKRSTKGAAKDKAKQEALATSEGSTQGSTKSPMAGSSKPFCVYGSSKQFKKRPNKAQQKVPHQPSTPPSMGRRS